MTWPTLSCSATPGSLRLGAPVSLPYPVRAAAQPCPTPLASLAWHLDWEDCLSDSGWRGPKTASQNPTPAGTRTLSATCPTSPSLSSILLGPSKEISHHHPLSLSCAHPACFRQLVHLGSGCWAWDQPSQHRPAPRSLHPGVRDRCWPVHRDVRFPVGQMCDISLCREVSR